MGVDCPDIRQVFHYGPPSTLEEYVQETGAGRDGVQSSAILLYGKPGKCVREYGGNSTVCRRQLLFQSFLCYSDDIIEPPCLCCDVCACVCECNKCNV